jgi:uncharacterized protein (UPF0297 family)
LYYDRSNDTGNGSVKKMNPMNETMQFTNMDKESANEARNILFSVYASLKEKGYNPVNQIVGYILSGDPTYITSYNNARGMIRKLERDELLEELVKSYLEKQGTK